jgi:Flp pilus assembly protein TadG
MRLAQGRKRQQSGQALIEFAISMMLFILCIFMFLGAMLAMETATEVNAATTLAASAAIQYPIGDTTQSQDAATKTFDATLQVYGISGESLTCSGGNLSPIPSTSPVVCHATAKLDLAATPLGVFWRGPLGLLTFSGTGQADYSPNRSCAPSSSDAGCP